MRSILWLLTALSLSAQQPEQVALARTMLESGDARGVPLITCGDLSKMRLSKIPLPKTAPPSTGAWGRWLTSLVTIASPNTVIVKLHGCVNR